MPVPLEFPSPGPGPKPVAAEGVPPATILIVDDLPANRKYLVTVLRHHGYRVLEAADGAEGLAAVLAQQPDLVITDVLMPVMDGYELVRQLRLDPATAAIPIVFYTAHYAEREARELALTNGVAWVLTKPAGSAMVLEIVVRALAGQADVPVRPRAVTPKPGFAQEHLRLVTDKLSDKAAQLRAVNARWRALVTIGLDLASVPDPEVLLRSVCVTARDLFAADYVSLGILTPGDDDEQRILTCGGDGPGDGLVAPWVASGLEPGSVLGTVVSERRTLRGDNPGGAPAALDLPADHPPVRQFAAAPVASPSDVYGWICLVTNDGRTFSDDDEQLLTALAGQIGRIYENGLFHAVALQRAEGLARQALARTQQPARAARRSWDQAQRYLDTAEVILLALDTEARVTMVSRYACAVLGWTAEDLLQRDWIETCVPQRMRALVRQRFQSLLTGDLSVVENPIVTRTGEERLIEWRNTLLHDAQGGVIGAYSSGTVLTGRTRSV